MPVKNPSSNDRILLSHGGGGVLTRRLVEDLVLPALGNPILNELADSAVLPAGEGRVAFTTDSFVIKPLFFRGGDIGKLSICGTVNDLAAMGAVPRYIALSLVLEEGLEIETLRQVLHSAAETSHAAGVQTVAGDTKVVERGAADGMFITTTGLGYVSEGVELGPSRIGAGDVVIISGTVGDHGIAVISERESLEFEAAVESDVAPLGGLVGEILSASHDIHFMRDPTRGGVAAALNELAASSGMAVMLDEDSVPVRQGVLAACEMLGFDPLYVANEGKMLVICAESSADDVLEVMRAHPLGESASIIGTVVDPANAGSGRVLMKTSAGGTRIVDMPYGEQLPRIC